MKTKLRCFGKMSLGAIMYGAGVSLFLDPNSLAPGGTVGISIILNRFLGISTGTLYLLINIPILILGARKLGANFLGKTLYVAKHVHHTVCTPSSWLRVTTEGPRWGWRSSWWGGLSRCNRSVWGSFQSLRFQNH